MTIFVVMRRLRWTQGSGRRDEQRASRLLDMSADLLGTITGDGSFLELNDTWEAELGYSRPELRALRLPRLTHPDDRERLTALMGQAFSGADVGEFEARLLARDGSVVWVRWRWESEGRGPMYARGYIVTARRRMERERERLIGELSSQARSDSLTGIPNRRWLRDELAREVSRGHRQGTPFCVAIVELDGEGVGDGLLVEAVDAWRDGLRGVDFLARYEDTRFAVVLPDTTLEAARTVVERLRALAPEGRTCSIGLAQWSAGMIGDDLVDRALEALASAHASGGNRIVAGPA
jgi:diguanylate cyclase (GGDEF)-like protein/PAS domain S-box-containing protein